MKTHRWQDIKGRKGRIGESRMAAIEAEAKAEAATFRALRVELGLSQTQVAELAKTTQGEISRFEQRADHRISRMREMVEAVGGKLKVVAVVGDKEIRVG